MITDVKEIGLAIAANLVVAIQEFSETDETGAKKHEDLKKIFYHAVRNTIELAEDAITDPIPDPIELIVDMVLDSGPVEGLEDKAAELVSTVAAEIAYQVFKLFQAFVSSDTMALVNERAKSLKEELGV